MKHQFAWHSPAPLWTTQLQEGDQPQTRFLRPEILRYAGDDFMEKFLADLASDEVDLKKRLLRPETWREEPQDDDELPEADHPVKLFQPTHGRYYLAVASLVCQTRGLPDRTVDLAVGESVTVVLRLVLADGTEYAWCGSEEGWKKVEPDQVLDNEERLPTFPLSFEQELNYAGRTKIQPRRLHAGLIPVSSVETYSAGPFSRVPTPEAAAAADPADPLLDPRVSDFEAVITDGLLVLLEGLEDDADFMDASSASPPETVLSDELVREIFALLVFDLHLHLQEHLGTNYAEVLNGYPNDAAHDKIRQFGQSPWSTYLQDASDHPEIEDGTLENTSHLGNRTKELIQTAITPLFNLGSETPAEELIDEIGNAIGDLPDNYSYGAGDETTADPNKAPKLVTEDIDDTLSYRIRFIYDRPQCRARLEGMTGKDTGRLAEVREAFRNHQHFRPLVSGETQPFTLAPYFDPDAPQRPIRITMPLDTSPSGLRKFPRNVAFSFSDKLRAQIKQASKQVGSIDEIGKGSGFSFDLGVICSFSLVIIFIVAITLLLIFVFILNIVFWWLPFFRICFPILLPSKKE